jgi:two-component system alkaline phosphatase synthesis response regulator PhoP
MPDNILIINDQSDVIDLLTTSLRSAGFQTITAANETTALIKAQVESPSLILLDPGISQNAGFDICRQLKMEVNTQQIPIILLSTKATVEERILGFQLGADDYVQLPFKPRELALRIQKSLYRADRLSPSGAMILGNLALDPVRHEVTLHNKPVNLSFIEFRLLARLMEQCGIIVDRETLLEVVWEKSRSQITRTVDTHICRLRIKLGAFGQYVEAIRGFGYRLNATVSDQTKPIEILQPNLSKAERHPGRLKKPKYNRVYGKRNRAGSRSPGENIVQKFYPANDDSGFSLLMK